MRLIKFKVNDLLFTLEYVDQFIFVKFESLRIILQPKIKQKELIGNDNIIFMGIEYPFQSMKKDFYI